MHRSVQKAALSQASQATVNMNLVGRRKPRHTPQEYSCSRTVPHWKLHKAYMLHEKTHICADERTLRAGRQAFGCLDIPSMQIT